MKSIVLAIFLACIGTIALNGCNTVRGAGQDISQTGHAISKAAS